MEEKKVEVPEGYELIIANNQDELIKILSFKYETGHRCGNFVGYLKTTWCKNEKCIYAEK